MSAKIKVGFVPCSNHLKGQLFRDKQFVSVLKWFEGNINQRIHAPIMYGLLNTTPDYLLRVGDPRSNFRLIDLPISGIVSDVDPPEPESGDVVIDPLTPEDVQMVHDMGAAWISIGDNLSNLSLGRYGNGINGGFLADDTAGEICPYTVVNTTAVPDPDADQKDIGGVVVTSDATSCTIKGTITHGDGTTEEGTITADFNNPGGRNYAGFPAGAVYNVITKIWSNVVIGLS